MTARCRLQVALVASASSSPLLRMGRVSIKNMLVFKNPIGERYAVRYLWAHGAEETHVCLEHL